MKRQRVNKRVNDGDGYVPAVERLYRCTEENYSGAGGFMDDDDEYGEKQERIAEARKRKAESLASGSSLNKPDDCSKCGNPLASSFLWEHFNFAVCDHCRNDKDDHKLLSRTEAKNQYMLKDDDLDLRKPVLRFISKKNPHNPRYGDMKLYLKPQLEQRCLDVYKSMENFENHKKNLATQKESRIERRFEKKIKEMRKQVRGCKTSVTVNRPHEHDFGKESYDQDKDEYTKICKTCSYKMCYEKL